MRKNIALVSLIFLIQVYNTLAQQSIFITPFDIVSKQDQLMVEDISDRIQARIVEADVVNVLERKKFVALLQEKNLYQTGLIDESMAVETGKLIGADCMVLGQVEVVSDSLFNLSSRFIDIESGKILNQWTANHIEKVKLNNYVRTVADDIINFARQNKALQNIMSLQNYNKTFDVNIITNKDTLTFGELLEIRIKPEAESYLYVFNIGTSGKIHLLFPNRIQPDNHVKPDKYTVIGNLRVGPPSGIEVIKAIATRDSISLKDMMDIAGSQATFNMYDDDTEAFSRDLELMVSPLPEDRWSSSTLRLTILENN